MIGQVGPTELIVLGILLLPLLLWIFALVDMLKNEFTGSNKIVWLLVVILVPVIGAIFYFLMGRQQKIKLPQ